MRSHRCINSLLCLVIQLVAKESKAKEKNAGIMCLFILFFRKALYIKLAKGRLQPTSQAENVSKSSRIFTPCINRSR